jgi:hypothetical protein
MTAHGSGNGFNSFAHPLLEQREENIFLALKIGVESASCVSGAGGDIFQARGFKAVLREDALGGVQQFPAASVGRVRLRLPRALMEIPFISVNRFLDMIHTCMYLNWVSPSTQALIA